MTAQVIDLTERRPRARTRKPAGPVELVPFTIPHFRWWSSDIVLDTGKRFVLEPFQEAFLADVFSGIPECWLIVPEGNGKTTLIALLALYHAEFRPFASVPVAASSREQAEILYRQGEGFVTRTPRLRQLVHSPIQEAKGKRKLDVPRFLCLEGYRRINHHEGSRIQVFAADDRTGDGVIPTLPILDELHRHRDLELYRTWAGKLDKRQGQLVIISTAGEPGSEFEETRERIRQTATESTRNGCHLRAVGPGVVLHEWAVPEKGDVTDMALVKAANPFSGVTVESLAAKFAKPTMTLPHWRRLTCNLATRGSNAAVTEEEWFEAETHVRIPEGVPIWLGLDVAWKWDTTAAVPGWPHEPEEGAAPGTDEAAAFFLLGEATILVPPRDGSTLDPNEVEVALTRIHERNPIHTVVMDTSKAEQLGSWIETELGATVIDRGQGNVDAEQDYERFMEGLRHHRLKHTGDAGLKSHVLNAVARVTISEKARFDRPVQTRRSSEQDRRVVDALSGAAMVHSVAVGEPAEPEYEPLVAWR